jgi:hypothetical protein
MAGNAKDREPTREERSEKLDRELEETFPASDPPSSIQPGTRTGRPRRPETETPSAGPPRRS